MTGWALIASGIAFLVGLACGVLLSICYAGFVLGRQLVAARERAVVTAVDFEQAIRKSNQPRAN